MKDNPPKYLVPLFCWDIYSMQLRNIMPPSVNQEDWHMLQDFQAKLNWNINLKSLLTQPFEALVLTDQNQVIQWASSGFTTMTGYLVEDAIGKSPRFLQGKNTSSATRKSIRGKLGQKIVFTESIINYRKNGEEYLCQVQIYPIENINKIHTHFLALEKEIA